MGATLGDYNGDGRPDLYVTNFADDYSTLYRGEERGYFLDVTQSLGLAAPTMDKLAWGTAFVDLDLDGDLELYAVNGHVYPQVDRFPPRHRVSPSPRSCSSSSTAASANRPGAAARPSPTSAPAAAARWGTWTATAIWISCSKDIDGPPRLLRNDGRTGHSLEVVLVGAGANREAVGARVRLRAGERWQLRLPGVADGFLSSSPRTLTSVWARSITPTNSRSPGRWASSSASPS